MVGFRVAAWACFAAALLSFLIGLVGLRGIGIVGQKEVPPSLEVTIDLAAIRQDVKAEPKLARTGSNASVLV
jgi:hypothetical protein